jgi:hypothetical protein
MGPCSATAWASDWPGAPQARFVNAALDDIGDLDDVRVVDAIDRQGFNEQALDRARVRRVRGGQRLHRRPPPDPFVLDLENSPRRANAQQPHQPVGADPIADHRFVAGARDRRRRRSTAASTTAGFASTSLGHGPPALT